MLNAEHLTIEGEFFVRCDKTNFGKVVTNLKTRLEVYMGQTGYTKIGRSIYGQEFFSAEYMLNKAVRDASKPKKKFDIPKLLGEDPVEDIRKTLYSIRLDYPYIIKFLFYMDSEGIIIKAISKPVFFFRIIQLHEVPDLAEYHYSYIVKTNQEFLQEVMCAVGATEIKSPAPQFIIKKTSLGARLSKINLNELKQLLEDGMNKLEKGDSEDGLGDLRACLEKFLVEMVRRIGKKPFSQQKVKNNLNILKDEGYIDQQVFQLVLNILYNWLYSYLSDIVHKRKSLNFNDSKFLFFLFEGTMDYILNKVLYKI